MCKSTDKEYVDQLEELMQHHKKLKTIAIFFVALVVSKLPKVFSSLQ